MAVYVSASAGSRHSAAAPSLRQCCPHGARYLLSAVGAGQLSAGHPRLDMLPSASRDKERPWGAMWLVGVPLVDCLHKALSTLPITARRQTLSRLGLWCCSFSTWAGGSTSSPRVGAGHRQSVPQEICSGG